MLATRRIQHCRRCGARAEYRTPVDDNRDRATCTACGEIHYENPLNVVGTVPYWGDQVPLTLISPIARQVGAVLCGVYEQWWLVTPNVAPTS